MVFGEERIAESTEGFGAFKVVGDAWGSGEVANGRLSIVLRQSRRNVAVDVPQQNLELRVVVAGITEVAIVLGFQMQRNVRVGFAL